MLKKKKLLSSVPRSTPFGDLNVPTTAIDADYVNQRVVSFGASDLDDMSATLGNFAFRVAIAGGVAPLGSSRAFEVTVAEVGVYVRDSYDFNGSQFLGFWDNQDDAVSMVNPLSGTAVSNSDFRDWRQRNGKGGDFIVFSDVIKTRLARPDVFNI